jgi:hypothetical protein
VVPLGEDAIAIACGHPTADPEALAEWANGVAARASKANVRRAVLSGEARARAAVANALEFVGIAVDGVADRPSSSPRKTPWLRLPWKK